MKRIALLAALAALATALLAASGAGAADPPIPPKHQTCTTKSENVITANVKGTVTSTNVDPEQVQFARCGLIKKVMNKMLSLRIEKPDGYAGFRCIPTVTHTEPDVVDYSCVFKGADTATIIRLKFTARYDQD